MQTADALTGLDRLSLARCDIVYRSLPRDGRAAALDRASACTVGDRHAFAVAGGVAGEPDSAAAAQLAVDVATAAAAANQNAWAGVQAARSELVEQLASRRLDGNAALAVAVTTPRGIDVAWAGNCRVYALHQDTLDQVTIDHTHGAQMRAVGVTVAEHDEHFDLLTSSVATVDGVIGRALVADPFDRLLLCSGGVTQVLTEGQLHMFLLRRQRPGVVLDELLATVARLGGPCSATALIAQPRLETA